MKKRMTVFIIVALLVLVITALVGVNVIFTVTDVTFTLSSFSTQAENESVELNEKFNAFVGKSMLFFNEEEVSSIMKDYPSLKLESVEREYPQTLKITVSERRELFALKGENGYTVYDETGYVVQTREENKNRADGLRNIELVGFSATDTEGETTDEYILCAVEFVNEFGKSFPEPRINLVEIKLFCPTSNSKDAYFVISCAEGVRIVVFDPLSRNAEKGTYCADKYAELLDEDKMFGELRVFENAESGEIVATYTPREQVS